MTDRSTLIQWLVGVGLIGSFLVLLATPCLERFEYLVLDHFFRQRPPLATHPAIIIIEIAEDSIQALGRWPWPRRYHARMADLLREWGAQAVLFDLSFTEASTPADDSALQEAVHQHGHVYLPVHLERTPRGEVWRHPLPALERSARGTGHINVTPDRDGVLRRIAPYLRHGDEVHPQYAIRVAYDALGQPLPAPGRFPFPLDPQGNLLVNWSGRWRETFRHYSYLDLLNSLEAIQGGRRPKITPEQIRGKICLIGLTATGHADIKVTPMDTAYPGVGVHANVINSLLTDRFVSVAPFRLNAPCLVGVGLACLLACVPFRGTVSGVAAVLGSLLWIQGAFLLLWTRGTWVTVVHPVLLILTLFIFTAVYSQTIERSERIRLFHLATRDGLTGLYVIRHFRTMLGQAIRMAHQRQEPLGIILIDIDNFKHLNDTYGHPSGNLALKAVAQAIQSSTRVGSPEGGDLVARYGGEEFIVALRNANVAAALVTAERIRATIAQTGIDAEPGALHVTASLGVAALHQDETSPDPMIRRADAALYQAKAEGKNRVCVSPTDREDGQPAGLPPIEH